MKFVFGALPPTECQWQVGKTPETIKLVAEIEQAISDLQITLRKLKEGSLVVESENELSVHDLLCTQVYST